jgi:hypothetical protein
VSTYVKPEIISLKTHPTYNERWVQERIAEDPSILQLGDIILKDKERIQPPGGRLDLLLQDAEQPQRYEVELQLGRSDEAHIIRTIEYWDIERRRFPQYDHCGVIVAEDITSRFLNVISLFNGFVPIIALQMKALQIGDNVTLFFTKVVDQITLGMVDEDEPVNEIADRPYWEKQATVEALKFVDQLLETFIHKCDPSLTLNYNKHYIGLAKDGAPFNFVEFRPRKTAVNFDLKLEKTAEYDSIIDEADLDTLEYQTRWRKYRFRLDKSDVSEKEDAMMMLVKSAYEQRLR